ncbi:MAG: hypothetical protein ACOCWW_04010 [Bacteroidota bacterium]
MKRTLIIIFIVFVSQHFAKSQTNAFEIDLGLSFQKRLVEEAERHSGDMFEVDVTIHRKWYGASLHYSYYKNINKVDFTMIGIEGHNYEHHFSQTFSLKAHILPVDLSWIRVIFNIGLSGTYDQRTVSQINTIHPDLLLPFSHYKHTEELLIGYNFGFDIGIIPSKSVYPFIRAQYIDTSNLAMIGVGVRFDIH